MSSSDCRASASPALANQSGRPAPLFDLQPTLRGKLLELRPLTLADFEPLFAAASDPLIWEQHPDSGRYKREVFQIYFDGAIESKGAFAIIERKSQRVIGSSRYCHLSQARSEVEIGWTFLERKFWGGLCNRELKTLMLEHAFQFIDRVLFVVEENNRRSRAALEKLGAKLTGSSSVPVPEGHVQYAIDRRSYHGRRANRMMT